MAKSIKGKLLIADDEAELKSALCETLADEGYVTVGAAGGVEALHELNDSDYDILLSDLMMPGMDGIQLLREALALDANLVGIIMTGQGTIATAVEAMKVGAFDYVLKPFNLQMLLPVLARAMDVRRLRVENRRLRRYVERLTFESPRYEMIGSGPAIRKVFQMVEKVCAHRCYRLGSRKERHGKGTGGAGSAPQQPAARADDGYDQLRYLARNLARKRALWTRKRFVYRRRNRRSRALSKLRREGRSSSTKLPK